jgi:hypothetical protein
VDRYGEGNSGGGSRDEPERLDGFDKRLAGIFDLIGEVLAEIDLPRDTKDYQEAGALVAQARAQIDHADARIKMD